MNNANLINQSSGEFEYYTPKLITELARATMGDIDLDPASNCIANENVKALNYFTVKENGLAQKWYGRVFLNHPFHRGEKACSPKCVKQTCKKPTNTHPTRRGHCITEDIPSNAKWINKLMESYHNGDIDEAVVLTFASTSEDWYWPLLNFPQCFPKGRIHYYKPDGTLSKQATKGSVVTYLGPNVRRFAEEFKLLGKIQVPYSFMK